MAFNKLFLAIIVVVIIIAVTMYLLFASGMSYITGSKSSSGLSFQGLSTGQQVENEVSLGIENNNFNLSYSGGFMITLGPAITNKFNASLSAISIPATYSISKYGNFLRSYTGVNISEIASLILPSLGFIYNSLPGYTMPRIPALSNLIKLWDIYNGTGDIGCVNIGNGTGCQYDAELLNVSSVQQWNRLSNTTIFSNSFSLISHFGNASFQYLGTRTYSGEQCSLMSTNESDLVGGIAYSLYSQFCFSNTIGLPLYYTTEVKLTNYSNSEVIVTIQISFNSAPTVVSASGIIDLPSGSVFTNLSNEFLGNSNGQNKAVSGFVPFTPTFGAECSAVSGITIPLRNDNNVNVTIWEIPGVSPSIIQSTNLSGNHNLQLIPLFNESLTLRPTTGFVIKTNGTSPCQTKGVQYDAKIDYIYTLEGINYTGSGEISGNVSS